MEWASTYEPSLLSIGDDLPKASSASRLGLDDLKKEVRGERGMTRGSTGRDIFGMYHLKFKNRMFKKNGIFY